MDGASKNIVVTVGLLAAGIGPLITLLGTLASAFAFVISPVGLAVAAILALGATFIYVANNWDAFKERLSDWSWWRNAVVDALQFVIKYNPLSAIIEAYNFTVGLFGGDELKTDNLFMDLADSLEQFKGETKEYENEFGSFGDAISNTVDKAKGKLSELGNALGLTGGGGGTAPTAPTAPADPGGTMGPPEPDPNYFKPFEDAQKGFFDKSAEEWTKWAETSEGKLAEFQGTFGQVFGTVGDILTQHTNNQKERLAQETAAQLENLQLQHEQDLEAIENSKMSEEAKNQALQDAEKDFQDAKLEIEGKAAKDQAKLARRQAKIDKATAAMGIIVNTATAVIKAVAMSPLTGGMPWAGIIAGLGAAQLGTVLAAPLPALAEGGLAFGETAAIVGDNPGANVDPEVIAPLSKLRGMLEGSQNVTVQGVIRGEDIFLSSDRYNKRLNTFS